VGAILASLAFALVVVGAAVFACRRYAAAQAIAEEGARRLEGELHVVRRQMESLGHEMPAEMRSGMLRYSEVGRCPMVMGRIDMAALARSVADEALGEYPRSRVVIGDLPPAWGDPSLMTLAWTHFIGNALKYSYISPAPRIEISARRNAHVEYRIRDNGIGFDMANRDKLFRLFHRLHRVDEYPGAGVGLAIAQLVVARHGGSVNAEGRSGEGAEFRFSLPLEARATATSP
jgi:light-regulated signal transduction histidine kinase (bacteriophytochrome)